MLVAVLVGEPRDAPKGGKATGGFVRARYAGWSLHPSCLLLVMASRVAVAATSLVMRGSGRGVAWRAVSAATA